MLCAPANTPHTSTGSGFTAPAALPTGLPTHKQLPKGTRHQEKHSGASCFLQDMTSELRSDGEQGYFGLPNVLKPKSNDCRFKKAVCVPLKFLFGSNKNSYVKKNFVQRHLLTTFLWNPENLALQGSSGVTIPGSVQKSSTRGTSLCGWLDTVVLGQRLDLIVLQVFS